MSRISKRNRANIEKVEKQRRYSVEEALTVLKSFQPAKFDESVELALRLGIDAKKGDQMVRGACRLPHGTGRKVRVLVFAKGEKEAEARAAGADFVGGEDLVEKIRGGWLDFDKAIATPDMMAKVGQIAKILGPRNLMPNPRMGTVTQDPAKAVAEEKAGRVEFRVDKAGIVHAPIGRFSFSVQQLEQNLSALIEQVVRSKPQTSKGNYLLALSIAPTMGPGIKLDISRLSAGAL